MYLAHKHIRVNDNKQNLHSIIVLKQRPWYIQMGGFTKWKNNNENKSKVVAGQEKD